MDVVVNNQMNISDVTVLNNADTFTANEYERNKQTLAGSASGVLLDFGGITTPSYIKLVSSELIHLTIGTEVIRNVKSFEIKGEILPITMENSSTTESKIDFIITA